MKGRSMRGHHDKQGTIPTNLRLLNVLEQLALSGQAVTPTQVNQALDLPKPTIHRLFATLQSEGFIEKDMGNRGYCAGKRARDMATALLSPQPVRTARAAIMQRLAADLGETCNIAQPDGDAMIYLERVETKWPLRIQLSVGTRVPLYCTASGKMYLSTLRKKYLDRYLTATKLNARTPQTLTSVEDLTNAIDGIRKQGHARDDEEFMDGMIAISVPILDARGALASTLSFHAPTIRMSMDEALRRLPLLKAAASDLSALLAD